MGAVKVCGCRVYKYVTEGQTDRHRDGQRKRQTDRQRCRHRHKQTDRHGEVCGSNMWVSVGECG